MAQIRNEALRTQLLECAIRHFSQKGYVATNLLEIAKEAGVSRGPLYYYFSNKADLYIAAVDYMIEQRKAGYARILMPERHAADVLREDFNYCLQHKNSLFPDTSGTNGLPDVSGAWNEFCQWLIGLKHEVFTAAKARGELRADCDIAELITFIYAFYHGINYVTCLSGTMDGFSRGMLDNPTDYFMRIVSERYLA